METRKALKWISGSDTPADIYITRIFNFGTWAEWQTMKKTYPAQQIEQAVRHPLRGHWTKRGKAFAEVLFECQMPDDALISYDA